MLQYRMKPKSSIVFLGVCCGLLFMYFLEAITRGRVFGLYGDDSQSRPIFLMVMYDSDIRCKAEYLGCFVPFDKKSIVSYRKIQLVNVSRTDRKKLCLQWCYNISGGVYAGVAVKSEECTCSSSIDGFISHKKSKQWAESRWNLADNCRNPTSHHIYRKLGNCEEAGSTNDTLIGWTRHPTSKMRKEMLSIRSGRVTAKECILKCERRGYTIAIPHTKGDICFCSEFLSIFKSAEAMAGVWSQRVPNMTSIPLYRTNVEDSACHVRFGALSTSRGPIALTSFPGSGNTWMRHLLEISTGVYTGSVYGDMDLYEGGLLGEPPEKQIAKPIIVKDHLLHEKVRPQYQSAILLVRNPYHAVLADWSRRRTESHTGRPTLQVFKTTEFQNFAITSAANWLTHLELTLNHKWKVLLVYYENLRQNPLREVRRVVHFLQLNSTDHQKYFERRLMCMQMNLAGHFKRPPKNIDIDPFKEPSLRQTFEDSIKKANRTLMKFHLSPLPNSYL